MSIPVVTNQEAKEKIAFRQSFRNHNRTLKAERIFPDQSWPGHLGRMRPGPAKDHLLQTVEDGKRLNLIVYVVYSYQTPIAWAMHDLRGNTYSLAIDRHNYSGTTEKHKAICRNSSPGAYHEVGE